MFFVQLRIAPQNPKTPCSDYLLIKASIAQAGFCNLALGDSALLEV